MSAMVIWRKHEKVNRLLSRISTGYRLKQEYMSTPPSKSLRYFVAIAATAAVFTIRFLLGSTLGDVAPLVMFTLSVVVSAWYGGLGPGLLATALSALLGDYFFIEPFYSFYFKAFSEEIELGLFLGIGISISILSHARLS